MTKTTLITTATGQQLVVESGSKRCWDSEEIAEIEINVADGTHCGICKRPLASQGQDTGR